VGGYRVGLNSGSLLQGRSNFLVADYRVGEKYVGDCRVGRDLRG
jgi:hypothetical protein